MSRLVPRALATIVLIALGLYFLSTEPRAALTSPKAQAATHCDGQWLLSLSIDGRDVIEQVIAVFASDGSLVLHSPPVVPALPGTGDDPLFTSDTVGSWQATGDDGCAFEAVRLLAADDGIALGAVSLKGSVTIDASGIGLDGTFAYDQSSGAGQTIASGTGSLTGTSLSR